MTEAKTLVVMLAMMFVCCLDCSAEAQPARADARQALAVLCPGRVGLAPAFERAASRYHLPAALLVATVRVESTCDPLAVGPKGTLGLGQIMPGTRAARGYTTAQLLTPDPNLMATARHLHWAIALCGCDLFGLYVYGGRKKCHDYGVDSKTGKDYARRVLGFWAEVAGGRRT
jgi:hypothetical protein